MQSAPSLLEQVLAASPDVSILVDDQGKITRVFGNASGLLGYAEDDLVGQPVELLLPPSLREAHVHQRLDFADSDAPARPMGTGRVLHGQHRDGHQIPLDIKLSPLVIDGQRFTLATARDISHLVQIQEDLAERAAALELLNQEKNRILGIAAHDLRNPLAALSGFADLVEAGLLGDLNDRAPALFRRLSRSINYMTRLIDGLVDFSAIESGHLNIDLAPVDFSSLVRESVQIQHLAAQRRDVSLILSCPPDLGQVHVDQAKFEQIVHNLVGNAIRYSPDGGHVRIAASRPDGHLSFTVEDDGPGLTLDLQQRVFQPFIRGAPPENVSDADLKGVGLGLAIVRRIVEGHGGTITVDCPPGKGARFAVTLPAQPDRES